jgi:hypothetical protein
MPIDPQFTPIEADICRSGVGKQALTADAWAVVPAIAAKLREQLPDQIRNELRVAQAVAYTRMGLRTLASEALRETEHPAKAGLAKLLASLPNDAVSHAEMLKNLEANLHALPVTTRDILAPHVESWTTALRQHRAFRTTTGVVTLRAPDQSWVLFSNTLGAGELLAQSNVRDGPFYLDGMHAPEVITTLFAQTAKSRGELQARVVLLAASPAEALCALCLRAMPDVLAALRVQVWIGADCPQRVSDEARARIGCTLGWVVSLPMPPFESARWPRGEPGRLLAEVGELQSQETTATRARVLAWDIQTASQRDNRLSAGQGVRVLLPTTRYSTYVQHAASDIAATLRTLGCEASVLVEPDEHSLLTPLALLQAFERFQPDIVLFINTLRSQLPDVAPPMTTVVTWVQDAMRHLFQSGSASKVTERDFIMGHLHPEMIQTLAIATNRTLETPVLASQIKFHEKPVEEDLRRKFACEVAYVSHQSETPQAFAARAVASAGDGTARHLISELTPIVTDMACAADVHGEQLLPALRQLVEQKLRKIGGQASVERIGADVLHQVVHPIAERALRQQMIGWAADLCDSRGWRLHLYGRGWERHERFAKYAKGELSHDESLRAAYQCARVHLHAGLGGMYHQRVLECALSGGCTLVRVKADDVRLLEFWAQNSIGTRVDAAECERVIIDGKQYLATQIAGHWESMLVYSLYGDLGMHPQHPLDGKQVMGVSQIKPGSHALPVEAAWLTGDIASSCFWSRESFIASATAAVTRRVRRDSLASWQQSAALRHYSLRSQLGRMFEMIDEHADVTQAACRSA